MNFPDKWINKKKVIIPAAVLIVVLVIVFIWSRSNHLQYRNAYTDWDAIQKRGSIRVGIKQNTTDYYVENGVVKGFHYDLMELFAKHFNLKAHYTVYNAYWDSFWALMTGKVDVLAMDLNDNPQLGVFFLLTTPHSYSSHVLVQHKNNMLIDENFHVLYNSNTSSGKPLLLVVPGFSDFYKDALFLSRELDTLNIRLILKETFNINYILDLVNEKEIDMAIADQKVMESSSVLYGDVDYSVVLTDTLPLHWAVNKQNVSLQRVLNGWLDSLKNTRHYFILLEKYYSPASKNRTKAGIYHQKINNNSISFYDDLIKKHAETYNLDWRLVAAVIYQESRFNSSATGKGGSYGLMQIMPRTAARMGMDNPYSAENQILYGCKYLKNLKERYAEKGIDSTDLSKFVLAAYNAGACHIDDARLLAEKKGYNPNSWKDVEKMLTKLSDRRFTKNIQLKCGNYNGKYAKNYVSKVWDVYRHYQNMLD